MSADMARDKAKKINYSTTEQLGNNASRLSDRSDASMTPSRRRAHLRAFRNTHYLQCNVVQDKRPGKTGGASSSGHMKKAFDSSCHDEPEEKARAQNGGEVKICQFVFHSVVQ
jgi:hypothetical protein